jgi:pimeloyl-ACP methyl ester carboxylesterase
LDVLDLRGVDLVAHSMGGAVALVLADRRPDLVGHLVLAEPNLASSPRPRIEPFTEETGFARAIADALSDPTT